MGITSTQATKNQLSSPTGEANAKTWRSSVSNYNFRLIFWGHLPMKIWLLKTKAPKTSMRSSSSANNNTYHWRVVRLSTIPPVPSWIILGTTTYFRRRAKWGRYKTRLRMGCRVRSQKDFTIKAAPLLLRVLWWLEASTAAPNWTFLGRM